jgi:hypothetical protein
MGNEKKKHVPTRDHPVFRQGLIDLYEDMGGMVITSEPVTCPLNSKCKKVNTPQCLKGNCTSLGNIARQARYFND